MMTPELADLFEQTYQQLQIEMAALSSTGKLVVAQESGHNIPVEPQDVVVDAI